MGLHWSPRILTKLMEVVQLEEDTQFLAETADPLPAWKWTQKVSCLPSGIRSAAASLKWSQNLKSISCFQLEDRHRK